MSVDALLAAIATGLWPFSIFSTAVLLWAAWKKPRIGFLTERAVIGLDIGVMVSTGVLLQNNRINGYSFFPIEVARVLFGTSLLLLAIVPVIWTVLFLLHRLGDGGRG